MKRRVDKGDVEAELAKVLRLELAGRRLDHDVAELLDMEKEPLDEKFEPVDVAVYLPAREREREPLP